MMKRIILGFFCLIFSFQLSAQTYDEYISLAMDAIETDSLVKAEMFFKEALKLEPANIKNALLFSNLGTIQRRSGKKKEALDSYSLALNLTPYSVTMLLNRASLYLEMDMLDKIDEIKKLFGTHVKINDRALDVTSFEYDFIGTDRNILEISIELEWMEKIEQINTQPVMESAFFNTEMEE